MSVYTYTGKLQAHIAKYIQEEINYEEFKSGSIQLVSDIQQVIDNESETSWLQYFLAFITIGLAPICSIIHTKLSTGRWDCHFFRNEKAVNASIKLRQYEDFSDLIDPNHTKDVMVTWIVAWYKP